MRIPSPVVELDEAHTSLRESSCHQAVVGEFRPNGLTSISRANRFRFFMNVHRIGGIHLHPKRHLVLCNSCYGLGIAKFGVCLPVDIIDRIQHGWLVAVRDQCRI